MREDSRLFTPLRILNVTSQASSLLAGSRLVCRHDRALFDRKRSGWTDRAKGRSNLVNGMAQIVPAFEDSTTWIAKSCGSRRISIAITMGREIACTSTSRVLARLTAKVSRSQFSTDRVRITRARREDK